MPPHLLKNKILIKVSDTTAGRYRGVRVPFLIIVFSDKPVTNQASHNATNSTEPSRDQSLKARNRSHLPNTTSKSVMKAEKEFFEPEPVILPKSGLHIPLHPRDRVDPCERRRRRRGVVGRCSSRHGGREGHAGWVRF